MPSFMPKHFDRSSVKFVRDDYVAKTIHFFFGLLLFDGVVFFLFSYCLNKVWAVRTVIGDINGVIIGRLTKKNKKLIRR